MPSFPPRQVALATGLIALTGVGASASDIAQPRSVRPSSFQYERYYSDETSPSDAVPAPTPAPPSNAAPITPVPVAPPSAAEPCDTCVPRSCSRRDSQPWSLGEAVCGCDPWMEIGGWTQLGYHSDYTPLSRPGAGNQGLSFNDMPHRLNLHQQWLYFERVADGSCGLDFGFRFDVMYGSDAQKTQAFGNPGAANRYFGSWDASLDHGEYGWAMPQLYGEVAFGDWSVIAGHFFTLVGYEVVTAPDNFFYSHSLTMFNSEPFAHTGVLATYSGLDGVTLYGGWTAGWDTGFDQANGGSNYLGGFSGDIGDDITVTYISTIGNFGARSSGGSGYSHSIVLDFTLTDSLNYVLQSDYVDYVDQSGAGLSDDQLGINQYVFYDLNDCVALGARLEWWKSDGVSYYEMTYGMNYRVNSNMILRPEIRHDWSPTSGAYADNSDHQTTFGIDWILTY
ncbi:hypothetical protein Pla123a_27960 [Posidoniimonas polymericola]|uniref:Porin n=1 Tax=Posidoniimonas polymericola TaxID=2528002 RepID=A0A5C5YMF5_9BACT|nr:outer membrane beta-barrel protein [Posidoniimonas polymericola]TWT76010.1 hypothetical protein Pla123a_27960 [Posidoniimonas polymericola]